MPACYILYSLSHDRYYIGATHEDVLIRFQKHNEKSYGTDKVTAYTADWQIYLVIECITYAQAVNIERHIKKMKSRTYKVIESLMHLHFASFGGLLVKALYFVMALFSCFVVYRFTRPPLTFSASPIRVQHALK